MAGPESQEIRNEIHHERRQLLERISDLADAPMVVLSFIWLILLIVDFTVGLNPILDTASLVIWGIFILHFAIEFTIAPDKRDYLRRNWLTAVSLALPAFRVVRVFRAFRVLKAARAARSVSLLRLITSLNRGMRAVGATLGRRGIGYVLALTLIITFAGAAGIWFFENPESLRQAGSDGQRTGLGSYSAALWWTAMMMTTAGSDYWPQTAEGRVLALLLAIYAFAVFGYITATIASHFIGVDMGGGASAENKSLNQEIHALRHEIAALNRKLEGISEKSQ